MIFTEECLERLWEGEFRYAIIRHMLSYTTAREMLEGKREIPGK